MKKLITSCALVIPMLALDLHGQATVGWRGVNNPTTPYWNIPGNWTPARVPGTDPAPGDKAALNSRDQPPCFITNAAAPTQFVMGDNNPSQAFIMNGGSLVTSNWTVPGYNAWNALAYNHMARLEVRNGGTLISSNHLWIGHNANARGTLVMNGGSATVLGMIGLGGGGFGGSGGGGIGVAQINGGTLNLAQWHDTLSISALSQLDIRGGTVFITNAISFDGTVYNTNDHTASIANFIAGGQITGYGGVGTVNYTYNPNAQATILTASAAPGAGGPYPVTAWPTNINPNLMAHYWTVDGSLSAPNPNWTDCLGLVAGGDQATVDVTFRGLAGKQATQPNINIFDQQWQAWNTNGLIDILLCVYGDANVLRSAADQWQCRRFQFLTGTTPTDSSSTVYGGTFSTNAYNSQWNWILFTITNNLQSNLVDRLVGTLRTNCTGTGTSTNYGGINGGTIRIQGPDNNAMGLTVRAVAFGQHGVFGTAADINQFVAADGSCPPILDRNLVGIDFNAGYTNYLQVINDAGTSQDVTFVTGVGPAGDQRKAVIPNSMLLNFGILSNYLGQACNDNVIIKVCVDYYDDPAFASAGVMFGPYAYAMDNLGDLAYPDPSGMATLQGTGKWIRRSWVIPGVNLIGVSTAPLTGGPQFASFNGLVAVSRCYIAALRSTGPLAGQDPLADCYGDPDICTGAYGNYAELDLANGITNGVDVGSSSGDQTFVVEMAGPPSDQRLSIAADNPADGYIFNFQILTNAMGPTSQGNMRLAMVVTYYDDPALAGQNFRPEVWTVQQFGTPVFAHMSSTYAIVLQGTGKWRDAYWEIGTISLNGVNQSPQAAARFQGSGPVHVSRIRYAVVRPCGATAGQNLLKNLVDLSAAPDTNSLVRLSWPYQAPQAVLQGSSSMAGPWATVPGTPTVEGGDKSVVRVGTTSANAQFFRLTLTPQ